MISPDEINEEEVVLQALAEQYTLMSSLLRRRRAENLKILDYIESSPDSVDKATREIDSETQAAKKRKTDTDQAEVAKRRKEEPFALDEEAANEANALDEEALQELQELFPAAMRQLRKLEQLQPHNLEPLTRKGSTEKELEDKKK